MYQMKPLMNSYLERSTYYLLNLNVIIFLFHLELEEALKVSEEFGVSCHRDSSFIFSLLYNCQ